jgi:glycosyltransferase involved in cell wall biosynthesis
MTIETRVTFVLPYYNEVAYLGATLASLAAQKDRRFSLILIDNASTDGSEDIARNVCSSEMPDISVSFLQELRPGKIFALATGVKATTSPYVATVDADTIYPPDFCSRTIGMFNQKDAPVAVLAFALDKPDTVTPPLKSRIFAQIQPNKCHSGGFGQAFDRAQLHAVGGFDPDLWPYVLEDHEIIHRIGKLGRIAYSDEHVCYPSDRRSDRNDCSWTSFERVLYKLTPRPLMNWFFYNFLAQRFERRGLQNVQLRQKNWETDIG